MEAVILIVLFYIFVALGVYSGICESNNTKSGSDQVPPIFFAILWPWVLGLLIVKLLDDE